MNSPCGVAVLQVTANLGTTQNFGTNFSIWVPVSGSEGYAIFYVVDFKQLDPLSRENELLRKSEHFRVAATPYPGNEAFERSNSAIHRAFSGLEFSSVVQFS